MRLRGSSWTAAAGRPRRVGIMLAAAAVGILFAAVAARSAPPVTAVAVTHDGSRLLCASQGVLEVRSLRAGQGVERHEVPLRRVFAMDFDPGQQRLLLSGGAPGEEGSVACLAWPSLEPIWIRSAGSDVLYDLALDGGGEEIAAVGADRLVYRWSLADGTPRPTLEGHSREILSVTFVPQSRLLVSAGRDQSLRVWDRDTGELVRKMDQHTDVVRAVAAGPANDGLPMIASAGADRTVRFWQPTIGRLVRFARLPSDPVCLVWSPDGTSVWVGCTDGTVGQLHATSLHWQQCRSDSPEVSVEWIYDLAVDASGTMLFGGGAEGFVGRFRCAAE